MTETLFTSQTPTLNNLSDGTPTITRGVTLEFAVNGTITGVRWWCPTVNTGTYQVAVWDLSADTTAIGGVALVTKTHVGTPTANDWNVTTLDTPLSVTSAKTYRVGVNNSEGRYVATSAFFAAGLTNGNINAPGAGGSTKAGFATSQGTFNISAALALPTNSFNAGNYFVDVNFTAAGGGTSPVTQTFDTRVAIAGKVTQTYDVRTALGGKVTATYDVRVQVGNAAPVGPHPTQRYTARIAVPRYIAKLVPARPLVNLATRYRVTLTFE